MPKATIKITNLAKCIEKLGDISEISLSPVIQRVAEKIRNDAQQFAPVDTGRLKGSITRKPLGKTYNDGAVIYTNLEYAPYQEYGTRKMKAQPFMKPAAIKNEEPSKKEIIDYIKKQIKDIAKK